MSTLGERGALLSAAGSGALVTGAASTTGAGAVELGDELETERPPRRVATTGRAACTATTGALAELAGDTATDGAAGVGAGAGAAVANS
jgi:hypothetical protein